MIFEWRIAGEIILRSPVADFRAIATRRIISDTLVVSHRSRPVTRESVSTRINVIMCRAWRRAY
jgi:hypothetical protein